MCAPVQDQAPWYRTASPDSSHTVLMLGKPRSPQEHPQPFGSLPEPSSGKTAFDPACEGGIGHVIQCPSLIRAEAVTHPHTLCHWTWTGDTLKCKHMYVSGHNCMERLKQKEIYSKFAVQFCAYCTYPCTYPYVEHQQ